MLSFEDDNSKDIRRLIGDSQDSALFVPLHKLSAFKNDKAFKSSLDKFRYVVPIEQDPTHFLSRVHREVLPLRGTTRFETEYIPKQSNPAIYDVDRATSTYSLVMKKVSSTKGVGPLAVRFPKKYICKIPPPTKYDMRDFPGPIQPCKHPFNSTIPARPKPKISLFPGPATYQKPVKLDRRTPYIQSFNGRRTLVVAVETKCCGFNQDKCRNCKELIEGDYWHLKRENLCRPCMLEAKFEARNDQPKINRLNSFKMIRDCSSIHEHEGNEFAKITLKPKKVLLKYQQREAYLNNFFVN